MSNKVKLNQTYILEDGREFTPVKWERGRLLSKSNPWADRNMREEKRFVDKDGNRLRKRVLSKARIKNNSKP